MNDRVPRAAILATVVIALVMQLFELPYALAVLRPMWVAMTLAYWAMVIPQPTGLLTAWLTGIALDVLLGTVLGQHALGLTLLVFVVLQLRGILALYPVWQESLVLAPVWGGYALVMFWIDGATGHSADGWLRWIPVLITVPCWPMLVAAMDGLRRQVQQDPAQL